MQGLLCLSETLIVWISPTAKDRLVNLSLRYYSITRILFLPCLIDQATGYNRPNSIIALTKMELGLYWQTRPKLRSTGNNSHRPIKLFFEFLFLMFESLISHPLSKYYFIDFCERSARFRVRDLSKVTV